MYGVQGLGFRGVFGQLSKLWALFCQVQHAESRELPKTHIPNL